MFCKYCGKKTVKYAKFCKYCGESIPKMKRLLGKKTVALAITLFAIGIYIFNAGYLSAYIGILPPIKTGEKTVSLHCDYAGKKISVNTVLYSNINEYYKNYDLNNKNSYIEGGYFEKFTYVSDSDKTIRELSSKIDKTATANHLNKDQALELAICFVQNIPYDDAKAKMVLSDNSGNTATTEQYPYQTLYENKGICTDKTYLSSAILEEMGYGTSAMLFNKEEHMALGVSVPKGYGSFGTGYAYIETTTLAQPGVIPTSIDPTNGFPSMFSNLITAISTEQELSKVQLDIDDKISSPSSIIPLSAGKSYDRIVQIKKLWQEIDSLKIALVSKKTEINEAYSNVMYWESEQQEAYEDYLAEPATEERCYTRFRYYPYIYSYEDCYTTTNFSKSIKWSAYSRYYSNYENAINTYNSLVENYNSSIKTLDKKINRYNSYNYN